MTVITSALSANTMQKAEFLDANGKILPSKLGDFSISQISGLNELLNNLQSLCNNSYCSAFYNEPTHKLQLTKNNGETTFVDLYSIIGEILGGSVPESLNTLQEIAEWVQRNSGDITTALEAITITDHRS